MLHGSCKVYKKNPPIKWQGGFDATPKFIAKRGSLVDFGVANLVPLGPITYSVIRLIVVD